MAKFVSLLIVTNTVQNTNNRAENEGNTLMLQQFHTVKGAHTMLTGQSIAYALRQDMQDRDLPVWRQVKNKKFQYGPNARMTMDDSVKAKDLVDDKVYSDTLLGYMVAAKGSGSDGTLTRASVIQFSDAVSTGLYRGCTIFGQGQKADGVPALYNAQKHATRYAFQVTFHMDQILGNPQWEQGLASIVESLMTGIQVGGNQSRHLSVTKPAMVAWREHKTRGGSLLFNLDMLSQWATDTIDEKVFSQPVIAEGGNPNISFNSVAAIPQILKTCGVSAK